MTQAIKRFMVRETSGTNNGTKAIEDSLKELRASNWVGVYQIVHFGSAGARPVRVGTITQFGILQDEGVKQLYIDVEIVERHQAEFEGDMMAFIHTAPSMRSKTKDSSEWCNFVRIDRHSHDGDLHCLDPEMIEGE